MLKIDFQHQLAKKIRVWKGPSENPINGKTLHKGPVAHVVVM